MAKGKYVSKASTTIKASASKVWDALTKPELIKQYMFGAEVTTDWQKGSPIYYRGVWEGKSYEDKGEILHIEVGKSMVSTYWSSMSGVPDKPENYKTVTYELASDGNGTRLTVTQDNNSSLEEANHSESNWRIALDAIKKMLEV
jgi:uncharacterized protein YndB with AHSA1/START domain